MAMDIGATIGERITFFRELAGWSRKDLWAATGITDNRIGKFETGVSKPYHWEIELIALHLNQPLNYFDTRRPVSFIGQGVPLFSTLEKDIRLKLVASRTFPGGLVRSEYAR